MAQPNTQGKGQNQEGQEDNLKSFTLGHKDLEGKVAEFLFDRGTYTIVDIVGEEKTVVFKSRSAQEAYTKWNVYIGRKKERPQRERGDEEEGGKREDGRRGRGNGTDHKADGEKQSGRQDGEGRGGRGNGGRGNNGGNNGRQDGENRGNRGNGGHGNGGRNNGGNAGSGSAPSQTPGQKSNQEVLASLRESHGLEGGQGSSKHRRRRRHGRGNGGNATNDTQ